METGALSSITTKAGKELSKRNITLVDETSRSIELTIWAEKAEKLGWQESDHPIVAVKGAKVSDYNGLVFLALVF